MSGNPYTWPISLEADTKHAPYIPHSLAEITPDWVKAVLDYEGWQNTALPPFRLDPLDAENSTAARLQFRQSPRNRTLPDHLFVKLCPDNHPFLGASEPNYYRRDYNGLTDGPVAKCFAAIGTSGPTNESLGRAYVLLLQDLSISHSDNKHIVADTDHVENLGHALGRLHAHRWGTGADPEGPHDLRADFDKYISHVARGLEPILAAVGDDINQTSRLRLTRLFSEDADIMLRRALDGRGLTLVHGDPNPTNILTRRESRADLLPLYLIDRQPFDWSLRLWLGASDLVYAAVPFWPEAVRRDLQMPLLKSYHRALLENGVQNYSWDDLIEDWWTCSCMAAFTAIEWGSDPASLEKMKALWTRQLQRALALLKDRDAAWT